MRSQLRNERGAVLILELVVLAVVLAAAGFAGYHYINNRNATDQKTPPSRSKPVVTSQTHDPYEGWKTYTSSLEKLSFKYPANWTSVTTTQSNVAGADAFAIQSPDGVRVSWIAAADGLGGACNSSIMPGTAVSSNELGPCPYWTVTDKQKLSGADLYFVAGVVTSDGSTYRPWCALQASDGVLQDESNMGYLMFQGKNNDYVSPSGKHYPERAAFLCGSPFGGGGTKVGTKAQAEALLSTPDYETAKKILTSAAY
jgi:hypothetical protein